MAPKTKVERSEHFSEIVDLLLEGLSPRKLSAYLKDEYGEEISYKSLQRYKQKHLNVDGAVAVSVRQKRAEALKKEVSKRDEAQKRFDKAVKSGVDAQSIIDLAISYGDTIINSLMEDTEVSNLDKARLLKEYIKLQIEFNKNNDVVVEVNNSLDLHNSFDDEEIRAILKGEKV